VARRQGIGGDLIDVVAAGRLTLNDPPGALDGIGIIDAFALLADSKHGWFTW
jgi:hypothetical protein